MWYETSRLPVHQPADDTQGNAPRPSVAGSLLCHVSVTHWCAASKCGPYSPERKERCRRLSADGAGKIVQLLNAHLDGEWVEGELTQDVFACADCHGKEKESDAMVKMNCATCHQFKDKHP